MRPLGDGRARLRAFLEHDGPESTAEEVSRSGEAHGTGADHGDGQIVDSAPVHFIFPA